ncbi:MAG: 2-amino-4-hydroxy-6-hydroxymethyldihydropteridine diphosphokinase [Pseudobdellovibrionaceae bacterium]
MPKLCLIAVSIDFAEGIRGLRLAIHKIREIASVDQISSVYKHFRTSRKDDLNAEIWVAAKITTHNEAEDLLVDLKKIEADINQTRKRAEIFLAAYDDEIIMQPSLTLPHPKLQAFALMTICGAEIWGDFRHPILKESLSQLAKTGLDNTTSEFLAQGKTLLDF